MDQPSKQQAQELVESILVHGARPDVADRLKQLLEDKARLDWLEQFYEYGQLKIELQSVPKHLFRLAIDNAMKKEQG